MIGSWLTCEHRPNIERHQQVGRQAVGPGGPRVPYLRLG